MLSFDNITCEVSEEGKHELPIYFPPPIYYSLNTAINLAVLLSMPEAHKWFYNSMFQLAFDRNWEYEKSNHSCVGYFS